MSVYINHTDSYTNLPRTLLFTSNLKHHFIRSLRRMKSNFRLSDSSSVQSAKFGCQFGSTAELKKLMLLAGRASNF
jgi:hypothetical protein